MQPEPQRACFALILDSGRRRPFDLDPKLGSSQLPRAAAFLVEPIKDGLLLIRIARDGSFGGDTWHPDFGEAREQAEYEFGDAVGEWREIPEGTEDVDAYVLSQIATQEARDPSPSSSAFTISPELAEMVRLLARAVEGPELDHELVTKIQDELAESPVPPGDDPDAWDLLTELLFDLVRYVPDPDMRAAHRSYFGDEIAVQRIRETLQGLEARGIRPDHPAAE